MSEFISSQIILDGLASTRQRYRQAVDYSPMDDHPKQAIFPYVVEV